MKYCGGKNKLGKEIAKIISTHIKEDTTNYIEPFCGSLGVIRHVLGQGLQNYYAYDYICKNRFKEDKSFKYTNEGLKEAIKWRKEKEKELHTYD